MGSESKRGLDSVFLLSCEDETCDISCVKAMSTIAGENRLMVP